MTDDLEIEVRDKKEKQAHPPVLTSEEKILLDEVWEKIDNQNEPKINQDNLDTDEPVNRGRPPKLIGPKKS